MPEGAGRAGGRWPGSLGLGGTVVLVALAALLWDAAARGWAVVPRTEVPAPGTPLESLTRETARHITVIFWLGYLALLDGLLERVRSVRGPGGSPVRRHPGRFALCCASSIAIWLTFEWLNDASLDAWRYHGLPTDRFHLWTMYALAFATICPALFLTAALLLRIDALAALDGPRVRIAPAVQLAIGAGCVLALALIEGPLGAIPAFAFWAFLLDPLNRRLGGPSIFAEWEEGRWGRTAALCAAGLVCGLLWEGWNYLAVAKWTYHLPFLGPLEAVRLFEMPLPGYLGYPPFAIECWVMFQTIMLIGARLAGSKRVRSPDAMLGGTGPPRALDGSDRR